MKSEKERAAEHAVRVANKVADEAARYAAMPQYARNFTAMGTASVGIAAADPARAAGLLEPYLAVLDETIVRPIVKLPPSRSPEFEEVFGGSGGQLPHAEVVDDEQRDGGQLGEAFLACAI